MSSNDKIILVMGASGNQGNSVARHLLSNGWSVRAMTRNTDQEAIKVLESLGADIVQGDMDDKDSLIAAMDNVYGVYSVQAFDPENKDKEIEQGKRVADVAKQLDIKHFVYASAAGAERYQEADNFATKWEVEKYIRDLDLPFTILRHTFFMDNFKGFAKGEGNQIVLQGFMNPDKKLQMVSVQDIGAFATVVLEQPEKFIGEAIELAGDEITLSEISSILSEAFEVPCEIQDNREKFQKMMKMFEWFDKEGYHANIDQLRDFHPQMLHFTDWLEQSNWNPVK